MDEGLERVVRLVGIALAYLGVAAIVLTTLSAVPWPDALSFVTLVLPDLDLWWFAAVSLTLAGLCLGTGTLLRKRRVGSHRRR